MTTKAGYRGERSFITCPLKRAVGVKELSKEAVLLILENIDRNLDDGIKHNFSISPLNQLLITLRYYATEIFFISKWGFIWSTKMYSVENN